MSTCECLGAWFYITASATVNCMQLSPPVRAIQPDFAARIPRQRYSEKTLEAALPFARSV